MEDEVELKQDDAIMIGSSFFLFCSAGTEPTLEKTYDTVQEEVAVASGMKLSKGPSKFDNLSLEERKHLLVEEDMIKMMWELEPGALPGTYECTTTDEHREL